MFTTMVAITSSHVTLKWSNGFAQAPHHCFQLSWTAWCGGHDRPMKARRWMKWCEVVACRNAMKRLAFYLFFTRVGTNCLGTNLNCALRLAPDTTYRNRRLQIKTKATNSYWCGVTIPICDIDIEFSFVMFYALKCRYWDTCIWVVGSRVFTGACILNK